MLTHGTSGGLLSSMAQTAAWRDWSVVFRSYAALVYPALKVEMQRVERLPTAENNAGLIDDEQIQASTDLTSEYRPLSFASAQQLRDQLWIMW